MTNDEQMREAFERLEEFPKGQVSWSDWDQCYYALGTHNDATAEAINLAWELWKSQQVRGEAVAWMDSSGYTVSDKEKKLNGLDSLTVPLFRHPPAPAVLDKPAQIGSTVFKAGVKCSTVIARTQREYEHSQKANPAAVPEWESEAKRAFWTGLEIGASMGAVRIAPRWEEYIEKRKSEISAAPAPAEPDKDEAQAALFRNSDGGEG